MPPALQGNPDIRKCLAEASSVMMMIFYFVHEGNLAELAVKSGDFAMPALTRRWQAGENDVTTSLAHPLWLAPPPPRLGAVVHELRGGVAPPPRQSIRRAPAAKPRLDNPPARRRRPH